VPAGANAEALTVGVTTTPVALLFHVAREKGHFERHGLTVTMNEYAAGALTFPALLSGEVDVATAAEYVLVRHAFERRDLKAIAAVARVRDAELVYRYDRGIVAPRDLRGKKVGLMRDSISPFFLERFLILNGLSANACTLVDQPPTDSVDALASGDVDAIAAFSPYTFQARGRLGDAVGSWDLQGGQQYYFLAITTERVLRSRRPAIEKLLRALLDAERDVRARPGETDVIMRNRMRVPEAYVPLIGAQQVYEVRLDQQLILLMESESRWLLSRGRRPGGAVPNFLTHIDWEPLEAVRPEAVGIIR